MTGVTDLWLFVLAGVMLNITPGPDMAFIMGQSARLGWRGGTAAALGVGTGCIVHILAAAVGISALIAASATAFTMVKLAGAAYLLYIGARMLLSKPSAAVAVGATGDGGAMAAFWQGAVINVLNPKVALFFLAFLPQFIATDAPSKAWAFVILGLIFNGTGTVWNLFVAWLAARAAAFLAAGGKARLWLERSLGALFLGLGLKLALAQRSP
ncbi:MAG: LysE family translocator [Hyphomicrobiaceae bacterium]|nr:MAG: LysE family translocator [Hyphomicrobiaceae bacterium]